VKVGTRMALFVGIITVTTTAWAWMYAVSGPQVRGSLGLLSLAFFLGMAAFYQRFRKDLTGSLVSANLALGAILHVAAAALVVAGDRIGELGFVGALFARGGTFLAGVLGLAAAFFAWTRARGAGDKEVAPAPVPSTPEARPEPPEAVKPWEETLDRVEDAPRRRTIEGLQRAWELVDDDPEGARTWLLQEARRLAAESAAEARDDDDVLTQAANLLEWGAQKLPELSELDVSDLLMGKVIADIRSKSDRIEKIYVDHRSLHPIHPITRAPAEQKCEDRAQAARDALPLLEEHGMRMSEDLIAAEPALEAYQSVTGFQVVDMGNDLGFVTFEGNGRREGLLRAFPETAVEVEVRHYVFDDPEVRRTIRRRVDRVRRWKGVA